MEQQQLDELLARVIEQARALRIPVSDQIQPQVKINERAKKRFGCCYQQNSVYTIELSARLLDAPEEAVCQTLAHEVLHTCPGCSNHGARWKCLASKMNDAYGYNISRTDSPEKLGLLPDEPAPYILVCTKCGLEISRTRLTSVVEHPERYRCRCGGTLKRKQ